MMHEGSIAQQGSYSQLKQSPGVFQTLMEEYGNTGHSSDNKHDAARYPARSSNAVDERSTQKPISKLLLDEERAQGNVSIFVYWSYMKAMRLSGFLAIGISSLILSQCCEIASSLFLGFWSRAGIAGFITGQYISAYGALGGGVAIFTYLSSYSMALAGLRAAFLMFGSAIRNVLRSPVAFHDRTPSGRITSRLTKDVQTVDDFLAADLNILLTQIAGVIGTFALILYTFPLFSPLLAAMLLTFWVFATFYRHTSR